MNEINWPLLKCRYFFYLFSARLLWRDQRQNQLGRSIFSRVIRAKSEVQEKNGPWFSEGQYFNIENLVNSYLPTTITLGRSECKYFSNNYMLFWTQILHSYLKEVLIHIFPEVVNQGYFLLQICRMIRSRTESFFEFFVDVLSLDFSMKNNTSKN